MKGERGNAGQQMYATELFQIRQAFIDASTKFCPFCELVLRTGLQEFCLFR